MLMLVRSAAALATMRPALLLRVLKKAARRYWNRDVCGKIFKLMKTMMFKIHVGGLEEERGRKIDDDDVYYYIRWRLKLKGETENMGV